jgi:hypothetical protein
VSIRRSYQITHELGALVMVAGAAFSVHLSHYIRHVPVALQWNGRVGPNSNLNLNLYHHLHRIDGGERSERVSYLCFNL